jgi:putative redox protein
MVETHIRYLGDLQCEALHGPSSSTIETDAPADNMGKARRFSPTDLVGVAMGTCMLTIMGIIAERHALDLSGATARVQKEMSKTGTRRIVRLPIVIKVPGEFSEEHRRMLEAGARSCPVHASLHPEIDSTISFEWGG